MQAVSTQPVVLGADFIRDPHTVYTRLRAQGPVHQAIMPTGLKVWLVTHYEQGRALLADARLSKNMSDAAHLFERHQTDMSRQRDYSHAIQRSMINMDPPDHTRLRGLVAKAFTMRQVTSLRPRIEQICQELLDTLSGRAEFDLVTEFASPLANAVISELIGVPEDSRAELRTLSAVLALDAGREAVTAASNALFALIGKIVVAKRTNLGDDLLSSLILAVDGVDRLSHEELLSITLVLFFGGFETTVNLIGNGMLALLRNPDQLAILRATPSLLPNAVEELLRYDSPANISHFRRTTEPVRVADVTIPADEFVFIGLTSANRDPAHFADPDQLDVTRRASSHLSFGHGIHHCVGAALARVEGEIAFGRLLAHFPSLTLAVELDALTWRSSMLHRGVLTLPVRTSGA